MVHVQAGGGTVADAKPDYEYEESVTKAKAIFNAVELAAAPAGVAMTVLVIDNYDSFTYNLVQFLGELGAEVDVVRNDKAQVGELLESRPDRLVISPGPCTPTDAGISIEASRAFPEAGIPTLGVCLGHQSMVEAFGGPHDPRRADPRQGRGGRARRDRALRRAAQPAARGALPLPDRRPRPSRRPRAHGGLRRRRDGRAPPLAARPRASSSTPSRCSRPTARRCSRTSWRTRCRTRSSPARSTPSRAAST